MVFSHLYNLFSDQHSKSRMQLSPVAVVRILLTVLPSVHYIPMTNFITGNLYFFIFFAFLTQPINPSHLAAISLLYL